MDCECHGEPAYWHRDKRRSSGGYWRCAVKQRVSANAADRRRREAKLAQQRDRYDQDPIYRIEKRLHDDARQRLLTIDRRRAHLASELGGQ